MIECDVVQEDGHRWDDLADEIRGAVSVTAPLVEQVTGLPVGEQVTVRLLTPRGFARANYEFFYRFLGDVQAASMLGDLSAKQTEGVHRLLASVARTSMRAAWPLIGGQYIFDFDGNGELLFVPRSLERARVTPKRLKRVVAHELTHRAQHLAGPQLTHSLFGDVLRSEGKCDSGSEVSTRALFEGHARWADTAVSTELFGRPPVTWGHREAGEPRPCLRTRVRGACLRALPFKLLKGNHYEDGARFIEHLVSHGGPELVNRVWTCPDLVPTTDEVDRPQEWIARATAPVAVTTPQQ